MSKDEFPPLPALGGAHAFRLGVTSYVYPAALLPNVTALAPYVDDVELVFFESSDCSNLPSDAELGQLGDLAAEHNLTYTVHFPIDQKLGSESREERERMAAQALRLIDLTEGLHPYAYLLHVDGIDRHADATRVDQWQQDALPLLRRIHLRVRDPRLICLENLDFPYAWCQPLLDAFGFSVCTDAGHLWQGGYDWRAHVGQYLPQTRVIHLYGTGAGTMHFSLAAAPPALARDFVAAIAGFAGVLTLETFEYDDTRTSIERLGECLKQCGRLVTDGTDQGG